MGRVQSYVVRFRRVPSSVSKAGEKEGKAAKRSANKRDDEKIRTIAEALEALYGLSRCIDRLEHWLP